MESANTAVKVADVAKSLLLIKRCNVIRNLVLNAFFPYPCYCTVFSAKFAKIGWLVCFRNPANQQITDEQNNADENITFLADMATKNRHKARLRKRRDKQNYGLTLSTISVAVSPKCS